MSALLLDDRIRTIQGGNQDLHRSLVVRAGQQVNGNGKTVCHVVRRFDSIP